MEPLAGPSTVENPRLTLRLPPRPRSKKPFYDYTSIPGCVFPSHSKDVVWPGGTIKTKLPWILDPKHPERNLIENVINIFIIINIHAFNFRTG